MLYVGIHHLFQRSAKTFGLTLAISCHLLPSTARHVGDREEQGPAFKK